MDGAHSFPDPNTRKVAVEMSLHVLAYNCKRVFNIIGIAHLMTALKAYLDRVT